MKYKETINSTLENESGELFADPSARYIFGYSLEKNGDDLSKFDKISSSLSEFNKVLVDEKVTENSKYRCLQLTKEERHMISCFSFTTKGDHLLNIGLETDSSHLDSDLKALYKVIESVTFP